MKVALYGKLAAALGNEVEVAVGDGCTITDLRRAVAAAHPGERDALLSCGTRACVDDVIVSESHLLRSTDRVELLPPVSGG